jgi:hypothetical protein
MLMKTQPRHRNVRRSTQISTDVLEFSWCDRVLLSTEHLKLVGESKRARKFTERYIGPYRIKRVVNDNAYELDLPATLKIHPVVNVSQLKEYRDGAAAFPSRPVEMTRLEPIAADDNGAPVFEVDRILDHRKFGRKKQIQYLVLWKGYPQSEATWEPIEQLDGALDSSHSIQSGQLRRSRSFSFLRLPFVISRTVRSVRVTIEAYTEIYHFL